MIRTELPTTVKAVKAWGEKLKEDQEFSWGHTEFEISVYMSSIGLDI